MLHNDGRTDVGRRTSDVEMRTEQAGADAADGVFPLSIAPSWPRGQRARRPHAFPFSPDRPQNGGRLEMASTDQTDHSRGHVSQGA